MTFFRCYVTVTSGKEKSNVGATNLKIVEKSIKDLKPYKKNPRKNDNAVEYVVNSIKEFGFKVPIVIDKKDVIVCGHTRYKACVKLGIDKVPCVVADDLTEEQINAYRLADNKVSEQAKWDFELLDSELDNIFEFDMEKFGFEYEGNKQENERQDIEYEENISIVIECDDEADAEQKFLKLQEEGYVCHISTL